MSDPHSHPTFFRIADYLSLRITIPVAKPQSFMDYEPLPPVTDMSKDKVDFTFMERRMLFLDTRREAISYMKKITELNDRATREQRLFTDQERDEFAELFFHYGKLQKLSQEVNGEMLTLKRVATEAEWNGIGEYMSYE